VAFDFNPVTRQVVYSTKLPDGHYALNSSDLDGTHQARLTEDLVNDNHCHKRTKGRLELLRVSELRLFHLMRAIKSR
jgi:hypothetical protein